MRRILLIPLCLATFGLALPACQSDGLTAEQKAKAVDAFTETANQYYAMGEYDRANAQCIKGLQLDPKNQKLLLVQAWTLQKRGTTQDIAAAERIFRDLQAGGDFRAVLGLGEALERRGLAFAEGAEHLKSGKRVTEAADPKERIHEYEVEAQKSWTEALQQYEKALALNKESTDCLNGLVRVEMLMGHTKEALAWDNRLIDTTQVTLDYWNQQILRTGLSTSDEASYRATARALTKIQSAAQSTAADLAMSLNRDQEALQHLDAALVLEPDRAEIYSRRAQAHKELGQPGEAVRDIDKFIGVSTLPPNHPDIQRAWRLRKECEDLQRAAAFSTEPATTPR